MEGGRSDSDESSDSKRCGGIPPHPSEIKQRPVLPPCSLRAEHHKKVFFSFYLPAEASAQAGKKKSGARKIRKAEKTFLRGGEPRSKA